MEKYTIEIASKEKLWKERIKTYMRNDELVVDGYAN